MYSHPKKTWLFLIVGIILFSSISAVEIYHDTSDTINLYTINGTEFYHNNLSGIQGGSSNEYYHLNQSTFDYLIANLWNFITSAIPKWKIDSSSNYLYNDTDTLYFNETMLNETIDSRDSDTDTHVAGDGIYLYNDTTTMYFNETKLNSTIDDRAGEEDTNCSESGSCPDIIYWSNESILNVNESDYWDNLDSPSDILGSQITNDLGWVNSTGAEPLWVGNSSTVARIGDCPSGQVVQNTTISGVECISAGGGGGGDFGSNGTTNYLSKFHNTTYLIDSIISDDGSKATVTGNLNVSGDINVTSGNDICITGGTCLSTAGGTSLWNDSGNYLQPTAGVSQNVSIPNGASYMQDGTDLIKVPSTSTTSFAIGNTGYTGTGANNILMGLSAGDSMTTAQNSVFLGNNAGEKMVSANNNVFIGYESGRYQTGQQNIGIGFDTLKGADGSSTGENNVAIGYESGLSLTTGLSNMLIGAQAGKLLTSGDSNIMIGEGAGATVTVDHDNTFIGRQSGLYQTTPANPSTFIGAFSGKANIVGNSNTYVGYKAGTSATGSQNVYIGYFTGGGSGASNRNTGIGYNSLALITSGSDNTATGYNAGLLLTTGLDNTFIGTQAGEHITTGDRNVFIGHRAGDDASLDTENDLLIIENSNDVTTPLIGGDFSNGYVGINTLNPLYPLQVNGTVNGISIFAEGNVSATGYNTRTSVYDKSEGDALDQVYDADELVNQTTGEIIHENFAGYSGKINITDYSRPEIEEVCNKEVVYENYTLENCSYILTSPPNIYEKVCNNIIGTRIKQDCSIIEECSYKSIGDGQYEKICIEEEECINSVIENCENRNIYPHTKEIGQVSLSEEVDVLRQGVAEYKEAGLPLDYESGGENKTAFKADTILAEEYVTNTTKDPDTMDKVLNFRNILSGKTYNEMLGIILDPSGKLSNNILMDTETSEIGSYKVNAIAHFNRAMVVMLMWENVKQQQEIDEMKTILCGYGVVEFC